MPHLHASIASARWGHDTETTTDASPISSRPVRCAMATRASGHFSAISPAILRTSANLDVLGIGTGQLAQASEQTRTHRNGDCHHRILGGPLTNTWTSLPESSARSSVARVPLEAPSQKATSTSHASTRRWLRAADLEASASSSNDAGMTWRGMPLARAALVAAASTPLALPVMIEAPRASELTYSVTRSGWEKCLLPTMATFTAKT